MKLNDISATAITTLKCHALDAQSVQPILGDREAMTFLKFLSSQLDVHDEMVVRPALVKHIVLRAREYDRYARSFAEQCGDCNVINVGCGFDHRFGRIDNGSLHYFDLDLPDVIDLKKGVYPENERFKYLPFSVFQEDWVDEIRPRPTMILAEGLFMYFPEEELKELFQRLHDHFSALELVCEVINSKWLRGWRGRSLSYKLGKQLHFGKQAGFKSGIPDSSYFESWNSDFRFLDDWSYLDTGHPSLGLLRHMSNIGSLRRIQWTVHYRLH